MEDAVELVRGRVGRIVGAAPAKGKVRPDEPVLIFGPKLPPLEKLTLEPLRNLPLGSGLPTK